MAKCLEIRKACQRSTARLPYGFSWTREFSRKWEADSPFAASVKIRPLGDPTGFQYSSSGGQSGSEEPAWPTAIGETLTDGSITWTAEAVDGDSLADGIASDTWGPSDPVGLTVDAQAPLVDPGAQLTAAYLSGGTPGEVYEIENTVTSDNGQELVARIVLSVV